MSWFGHSHSKVLFSAVSFPHMSLVILRAVFPQHSQMSLHSFTHALPMYHDIGQQGKMNFNECFHYFLRMAAFLLKRLMLQTVKTENNCIRRCFSKHVMQKTTPVHLTLIASAPRLTYLIHTKGFNPAEDTQDEKKKKKKNDTTFTNIGRKISERIIRVIDEQGSDLGVMHRADAIRLMDERGLRLVQRSATSEPAEYQLMTGVQIHRERLRLRDSKKARPKTGRLFCCLLPGSFRTTN
jgi:hypothetical protein